MNEKRQPFLLGFAGHRKVADKEALARVLRAELELMKDHFGGGLIAISSAAAGGDLVFLKTCVELRVPTLLILPFADERFGEDFEDREEWELAKKLMGVALDKHVLRGHAAPGAYREVSWKLVEWADAFLFVWDGQASRGPGGTGETVAEARDLGIPSRVVDSTSLDPRWAVPLDHLRPPRHGFARRLDLLDFLGNGFKA